MWRKEERRKEKLGPKQEYEKHVQHVTSWYLEQKPMREKEICNIVGKVSRHAYQKVMRSTPTFCYGI